MSDYETVYMEQYVFAGETVAKPIGPTENYEFIGWYPQYYWFNTSDKTPFDFTQPINDRAVLVKILVKK